MGRLSILVGRLYFFGKDFFPDSHVEDDDVGHPDLAHGQPRFGEAAVERRIPREGRIGPALE